MGPGRPPQGGWLPGQLRSMARRGTLGLVSTDDHDPVRGSAVAHDPFDEPSIVPVDRGMMTVARAGRPPEQAATVVLAIHGITSNGMIWRSVAREVIRDAEASMLAPDLRGRGQNTALPGPYGIATHVADMVAVLDRVGVERAVLVGHSMGAYVAARIAVEYPDRTAGLVLVDGGTPACELTDEGATAAHGFLVGPAIARRAMPFASVQAYLTFWRHHPAFADAWNDDVEAYVLHDLIGRPGAFRYVISIEAIEADSEDMLRDATNRTAINEVRGPLYLLRAERGVLGDDHPLIRPSAVEAFCALHPDAWVEDVSGANHYTLLLGDGPGPARVSAAIEDAAL